MEKILKITETEFQTSKYSMLSGYSIVTNKQEIKFGISNDQSCCENWGYFSSNDDFDEFIGSEILSIEMVDSAINVKKLESEQVDIDDCIFVNIKTSVGLLQFAVYNEHNGYYGHNVKLISEQLKIDVNL